jgi:DMSO/TMAO reductase YedYZ heme-binding membrane subunit
MEDKMKIHLTGISLILLVFIGGYLLSSPQKLMVSYVSGFGFLSLLWLLIALALSVLPKSGVVQSLSANRALICSYSFFFALIHVILVGQFFFSWNLSKMAENQFRLLGAIALLLFTAIMSLSSSIFSSIIEKHRKAITFLTYISLLLVLAHASSIGMIFMKNEIVKWVAIFFAFVVVTWKLLPQSFRGG